MNEYGHNKKPHKAFTPCKAFCSIHIQFLHIAFFDVNIRHILIKFNRIAAVILKPDSVHNVINTDSNAPYAVRRVSFPLQMKVRFRSRHTQFALLQVSSYNLIYKSMSIA